MTKAWPAPLKYSDLSLAELECGAARRLKRAQTEADQMDAAREAGDSYGVEYHRSRGNKFCEAARELADAAKARRGMTKKV